RDRLRGEGSQQLLHREEGVAGRAVPVAAAVPDPGDRALSPDDPPGVRRKKGVAPELVDLAGGRPGRPLRRGAIEEEEIRQVQESRGDLRRFSGWAQVLHQRGGAHEPSACCGAVPSARRRRWVSFTCSDRTSSGGVRYPQASAPSCRYVFPCVMASLAFFSSRPWL